MEEIGTKVKFTVYHNDTERLVYCRPCDLVLAELSGKNILEVLLAERSRDRHLEIPRKDGSDHDVMTIKLNTGFARRGIWTNGESIVGYEEMFLMPADIKKEQNTG